MKTNIPNPSYLGLSLNNYMRQKKKKKRAWLLNYNETTEISMKINLKPRNRIENRYLLFDLRRKRYVTV